MTNKEAIAILECLQEPEAWEPQISEDAYTALQIAIDALGADTNVGSKGDMIRRKDTIDLIEDAENKRLRGDIDLVYPFLIKGVRRLPSVQPTQKTFTVIDLKIGEEADPYDIALHEDWAKHLMYCDMEGFAVEEDGTLILLDECGRHEYCPEGRFEVRWDEG